jgi:hypothetical protein
VARDATARLYDVDDSSVVYTKPGKKGKYDHGTITFRARKGKLVDLDKLHESVWATRLSGGTSSGLVRLDVTAVGEVVADGKNLVLKIEGSKKTFILGGAARAKTGSQQQIAFQKVKAEIGNGNQVSITGQIEGWRGRWPEMLSKRPASPRRIIVAEFSRVEE